MAPAKRASCARGWFALCACRTGGMGALPPCSRLPGERARALRACSTLPPAVWPGRELFGSCWCSGGLRSREVLREAHYLLWRDAVRALMTGCFLRSWFWLCLLWLLWLLLELAAPLARGPAWCIARLNVRIRCSVPRAWCSLFQVLVCILVSSVPIGHFSGRWRVGGAAAGAAHSPRAARCRFSCSCCLSRLDLQSSVSAGCRGLLRHPPRTGAFR